MRLAPNRRPTAPPSLPPSGRGPHRRRTGLERFDANIRYLNDRALELDGANLFSGVESVGASIVHVSTTPAWQSIPPVVQRTYLDSLYDLWTGAWQGSGPAVVRIVDANGRVLLEKSGNAQDDAAD